MPIWAICPLCLCYSSFTHFDESDCRKDLAQIIMSLAQYRTAHKNFTPKRKDYR